MARGSGKGQTSRTEDLDNNYSTLANSQINNAPHIKPGQQPETLPTQVEVSQNAEEDQGLTPPSFLYPSVPSV